MLTGGGSLHAAVAAYLEANRPTLATAYLLGGFAALRSEVGAAVSAIVP
jgi:hypothetical protein